MKHYEDFALSDVPFHMRDGPPKSFPASLGHVLISFSQLEDEISSGIGKLLALDPVTAQIVVADMGFRNKTQLMASLVRHRIPTTAFNTGDADPHDMFSELLALCIRSEELRNRIIHSSWRGWYTDDDKVEMRKSSARGRRGLDIRTEEVDSAYIMDVSDFICYVAHSVYEFFMVVKEREP